MDADVIVGQALELLREEGLNGVTIRRLAARLEVKAPSIYWRFADKQALLDAMAEAILCERLAEITVPPPEEPWRPWLTELLHRLREAMLAYPDGARVVTGARPTGAPHLAMLTEAGLSALESRGLSLPEAATIVYTAAHYTFGHVIEEQDSTGAADMDQTTRDAFAGAYPRIVRALTAARQSGTTQKDLFDAGLRRILGTD